MKIQFTVASSDNPSDPDRPYWIDCNRDFNTGYEDFTEAEAHAVCAILNDADHMLDWDTITADCRWKLVEAQAEIERLKGWLNSTQTGVIELAINQLYQTERIKYQMNTQVLTEAVAQAIVKMEKDGIIGWGLDNPDKELFERIEWGSGTGCITSNCAHNSHDPWSPTFKLIPKNGKLVHLGSDGGEVYCNWYTVVSDNAPRFFELRDPRHYWASIKEIEVSQIPEWALAQFVEV